MKNPLGPPFSFPAKDKATNVPVKTQAKHYTMRWHSVGGLLLKKDEVPWGIMKFHITHDGGAKVVKRFESLESFLWYLEPRLAGNKAARLRNSIRRQPTH